MIYLLDTNIVSETAKASPNQNTIKWLESVSNHHLAVSVLTLGEIRKGIEMLHDTKKKMRLVYWLETELTKWFGHRILNIDSKVADKWGYIEASTAKHLSTIDGLIAASAMVYGLKLVTRNVKDFKSIKGLETINPFEMELEAL